MLKKQLIAVFFGVIAFILMILTGIPVLPAAGFLKYDPGAAILLLSGMLFGARYGIYSCFVKDFLFFILGIGNIFGVTSDFISNVAYVVPAVFIINKLFKERVLWKETVALVVAVMISTLIMLPTNLVILKLEFGKPLTETASMFMPIIIPFNLIKGVLNSLLYLLLLRRFIPLLQRSRL